MKKLSAFTIIELVITLLISSVITAISYYAFSLMNVRFGSFYNGSQERTVYQLFNRALQQDAAAATEIISTPEDKELIFNLGDSIVTRYEFTDGVIIRQQLSATDSFKLVSVIDSVKYFNDTVHLISCLQLQVKVKEEFIPVVFFKEYTSQELIKYYTVLHE